MTYFKLNTLLACSVSICMAAAGPSLNSRPSDEGKARDKETFLPGSEPPLRRGNPEKGPTPTPPVEEETPSRDDPSDSPAGSDDKKDCDECVLVLAPGVSGGGSPYALASTLWGLFCVGRPRSIPRPRIKGLTVP